MECWRKKKEKDKATKCFLENGSKFLEELIKDCNGISNPIRMFSSEQISKATDHFNVKCILFNQIEFIWYKSVIEGRPYAFKKFSDYYYDRGRAFYNDIALSSRVSNHSSFLKLIGCSLEFSFPVLVFENIEYRALNRRGSVGSEDGPLLPWNVRLKIAKEVAIAVTYLHTAFPRIIIHRDIKPENVFLDENWNAKLTDFSLSVTLPEGKTWIQERVMGTPGYVDPNYLVTGIVTQYSDVYNFGIFALILLIGRAVSFPGSSGAHRSILDYVKDLRERGEAVDFGGELNDIRHCQMNRFLELALSCCEGRHEDRPKMIFVAKEIKLIERSLDFQTRIV